MTKAPAILEYVERNLRNESCDEDQSILEANKDLWRSELLKMKRKAETQMTSHRARVFTLYKQCKVGDLSESEYIDKLEQEKIWKINASRFIQQIEFKLMELKVLEIYG